MIENPSPNFRFLNDISTAQAEIFPQTLIINIFPFFVSYDIIYRDMDVLYDRSFGAGIPGPDQNRRDPAGYIGRSIRAWQEQGMEIV